MSNQLPIKWKSNIFTRFINFFRKNKIKEKNVKATEVGSTINENKNITPNNNLTLNFTYEKSESQKKHEALQDIIKMIENNPNTLYKLDIQKLNIINNYYDEKILKLEKHLARLKKSV